MANVKISELPQVSTLSSTDVLPTVASSATSKITLKNLANTMPQVTSSISASYAQVFPYVGEAQITGSLKVAGTASSDGFNTAQIVKGRYIFGSRWYNVSEFPDVLAGTNQPAFPMFWGTNGGATNGSADGYTFNFDNKNIGHLVKDPNTSNVRAGSIKFVRYSGGTLVGGSNPEGTAIVPYFTVITDNATIDETSVSDSFTLANGRYHVLTVTGSILSKDGVTLGTNTNNKHYVTGSVQATGSFTQNGFVTLTQVSQSLNFADDTAAAAGGVPLGGLYRNGNVIAIRIS